MHKEALAAVAIIGLVLASGSFYQVQASSTSLVHMTFKFVICKTGDLSLCRKTPGKLSLYRNAGAGYNASIAYSPNSDCSQNSSYINVITPSTGVISVWLSPWASYPYPCNEDAMWVYAPHTGYLATERYRNPDNPSYWDWSTSSDGAISFRAANVTETVFIWRNY